MKGLIVIDFMLFFSISFAQEIQWVKQSEQISLNHGANVYKSVRDNSDNILILYWLKTEVKLNNQVFVSATSSNSEFLLVKYDQNGVILWSKQFGFNSSNFGGDIAVDHLDNVLITGTIRSDRVIFGQVMGPGNAFVAKLNSAGDLMWLRQYGDATGSGQEIEVADDGSIIAAGKDDSKNIVVHKYSPNGDLQWSIRATYLSCCLGVTVTGLKIDRNNNVIIGGGFSGRTSFAGTILNADGMESIYIWKISSTGTSIWLTRADSIEGGIEDISISEIEIDLSSNDIYMTGVFTYAGKFGETVIAKNTGNNTGYVTKINESGKFVWAKPLYTGEIYIEGLTLNNISKTLHITGRSITKFNYDNQFTSVNTNPGFILSVDLNGAFSNSTILVSDQPYISVSKIIFDRQNQAYVMGNFSGKAEIGCFEIKDGKFNFSTFLYKTALSPKLTPINGSTVCLNNTIVVALENATLSTSFRWLLSEDLEAKDGILQTTEGKIELTAAVPLKKGFAIVQPESPCYPDSYYGTPVEVIATPAKPPTPSGPDPICPTSVYKYFVPEVDSSIEYHWEVSEDILIDPSSTTTSNEILLKVSQDLQSGSVRVKAVNACGESTFSERLEIATYASPSPPIISGNEVICEGADAIYTVQASGAQSFRWILPVGLKPVPVKSDTSIISVNFATAQSPLEIFAVAKGICKDVISEPFTIGIIPHLDPPSEIIGDIEVCSNSKSIVYEARNDQPNVSIHWSYPDGFEVDSQNNNQITFNISDEAQSGTIVAHLTNDCFTSVKTSLPIQVASVPDKPVIKKFECDKAIEYEGSLPFTWYYNNIMINDNANPLTVRDSGAYRLTVKNFCGTVDSDEIYLYPVLEDEIFISNVVTADGNGKNDFFVVDKSLTGSVVEVFNRWGKPIYHSGNYDNNWTGSNEAAGIYYYVIHNICLQKSIKGFVQIIK